MSTPGASTWGFRYGYPRGFTVSGLSVGPQLEWGAYRPLLLPLEPTPVTLPYRAGLPTVLSPGGAR
ncbi:MAG: hypothetical protein BWY88_00487 [Synergistetes bacterium ADurb.Bin520]|nr:MAG: hypothetical protein BWY88_00487 [Synergistetes bacterium ADurb.Bin520]